MCSSSTRGHEVIRFIDLREQSIGYRFAFWDTNSDRFCEFDDEHAWDSVEDFTVAFNEKPSSYGIQRFINLMPAWAMVKPEA